jgi:peptidoglycan/LPS O-acetylase OafA/YrhL
MPQLDGLRFVAAFIVVLNHFLDELNFDFKFPTGFYGVQIFFAISGFLITGILLRQKDATVELSKKRIIKNFFIKRFLRLFPPYYLLIAFYIIMQSLGLYIAEPGWIPFYLTYLPNWFFYYHGWQGTVDNHLWSLGVEEQFYLLWPFLILTLPRKQEYKWILCMIVIGYIFKCIIHHVFLLEGDPFLLPLAQMDTLGIGALLACAVEYKMRLAEWLKKILPYLLPLSIVATIYVSYDAPRNDPYLCFCLIFMTGSLVYKTYLGFDGILKSFFENKFIIYGGKISYGVYLYHKVIPILVESSLRSIGIIHPSSRFVLIISIALTFIVAHFSWIYIEKPILKLKDRFEV